MPRLYIPMRFFGIIPARYASTRFPGKPLADIGGKSMVQRVYEQASISRSLHRIVVATDDERIEQHVKHFGGNALMTSPDHPCGTDRCCEAAKLLRLKLDDVVINIQGDEPFIHPSQIDLLARCFNDPGVKISTLIKKIEKEKDLFNTDIPKVVINNRGEAIYFSRQPIPYSKGNDSKTWLKHHTYYKHIGIYGYRYSVLQQISALSPSLLEKAESLEQLRWIEGGYIIKTALTDKDTSPIDTPADLLKTLHRFPVPE